MSIDFLSFSFVLCSLNNQTIGSLITVIIQFMFCFSTPFWSSQYSSENSLNYSIPDLWVIGEFFFSSENPNKIHYLKWLFRAEGLVSNLTRWDKWKYYLIIISFIIIILFLHSNSRCIFILFLYSFEIQELTITTESQKKQWIDS